MAARMLNDAELTEVERRIVRAVARNETVDLRQADDDVADGGSWGPDRTVRAEVLGDLLTHDAQPAPRALSLAGARITGTLGLEGMALIRTLALEACYFEQPVLLGDARAARLLFDGSHVPLLDGSQLETRGDLSLAGLVGTRILSLRGARIGGELNLRDATLTNEGATCLIGDRLEVRLKFDGRGLRAVGEVSLENAHIAGRLSLSGATIHNEQGAALYADGLRVDGGAMFEVHEAQRFEAHGSVRLLSAHIGSNLDFSGALLTNTAGPALAADGMTVGQGTFFTTSTSGQRLQVTGEMRLTDVHSGNVMTMGGAELRNDSGPALVLDRLRINQGLFCDPDALGNPFVAWGGVRMLGAHIGGQLVMSGAQLHAGGDRDALSAEGAQIGRAAFLGKGFRSDGEIRMVAAEVGGRLSFMGARLTSASGTTLQLEDLRAESLWLPSADAIEGTINLRDVTVHDFADGVGPGVPGHYHARLAGFTYQALAPFCGDCASRLDWIRRAETDFVPHAYDQLAAVFRAAGREEDARRVLIAKLRHRRETLKRPARLVGYVLDGTVGFGYRTWRAAAALVAMMLVGWLVFSLAHDHHMTTLKPDGQRPHFYALLYSIDSVLPVVTLGQETSWSPTGAALGWYAFSVLSGWLLGLGLIAYVTATFFRE